MKKRTYQTFKWIFECIAIVSFIITIIIAAVPYAIATVCNILKELLEDTVRRIERKEAALEALGNIHHDDPLDDLLDMDLDGVFELVKVAYEDYIEDEGCSPEVAKVKALEDFVLWYYNDADKERDLRKKVASIS